MTDPKTGRRQRRDYKTDVRDGRYGDKTTGASTIPVADIESFKLAILEVVMCKKPLVGQRRKSVASAMGLGTANAAGSVREEYTNFECETLCESAPGAAIKDTFATGGHASNAAHLWGYNDTQARVDKYEQTLDFMDFKDPKSLAAFKDKCKSTSFSAGTYHWGWVIYSPVGKIKATIAVDKTRTLYTHKSSMEGKAVLTGDAGVTAAAMSKKSFLEGPADETSFYVADSGSNQQNFYTYALTEPLTMKAGEAYTLSLAFDLESLVDAFAGLHQPCSYPDHPCDRGHGRFGEQFLNGMSGEMEDTRGCQDLAYSDWTRLPPSECVTKYNDSWLKGYGTKKTQADEWNLNTLMDHNFNAFDIGYLQLTPLLHKSSDEIWRQRYSIDLSLDVAKGREAQGQNWMSGSSIIDPRRGCEGVIQLLYALPSSSFACPANAVPIKTPVRSFADCVCMPGYATSKSQSPGGEASCTLLSGAFAFSPISVPSLSGSSRQRRNSGTTLPTVANCASAGPSFGPTVCDAPVAASYSMAKCYYRDRSSRASNQQALSPRKIKAKAGATAVSLAGGWTPWMDLVKDFNRLFVPGEHGKLGMTCFDFDSCHRCGSSKKWTRVGLESGANCYDMSWGPGFPNQDSSTCDSNPALLKMLDGLGSENRYKCMCDDGTDGSVYCTKGNCPHNPTATCDQNCWEFSDKSCDGAGVGMDALKYTLTDVGVVFGIAAITQKAVDYCEPVPALVKAATDAGCLRKNSAAFDEVTPLGQNCTDDCKGHFYTVVDALSTCASAGSYIRYPGAPVLVDDALVKATNTVIQSLNGGNCTRLGFRA